MECDSAVNMNQANRAVELKMWTVGLSSKTKRLGHSGYVRSININVKCFYSIERGKRMEREI